MYAPFCSLLEANDNINLALNNLESALQQQKLYDMFSVVPDEDRIDSKRIKLAIEILNGNKDDLLK